jgi:hypothetical protein
MLIHSGLWMVVTLAWMLLCRIVTNEDVLENEATPEQAAAEDRKGKRPMTAEQLAAEQQNSELLALERSLQAQAGGLLPEHIAEQLARDMFMSNANTPNPEDLVLDEQRESLPVRAPSPPDAQCSHVSGQKMVESVSATSH